MAERRKILNISNEQPARHIFNFANCPLDVRCPIFISNLVRLPKRENDVADDNLVSIAKPDRLRNPTLVYEGAVTAAEIDQPKFAHVLHIDDGMPPRNLWPIEHDGVLGRSAYRTTAMDRNLAAPGLQPSPYWSLKLRTNRYCTARLSGSSAAIVPNYRGTVQKIDKVRCVSFASSCAVLRSKCRRP
jgi:hypothetical protein